MEQSKERDGEAALSSKDTHSFVASPGTSWCTLSQVSVFGIVSPKKIRKWAGTLHWKISE
jgi:hypothetical protein